VNKFFSSSLAAIFIAMAALAMLVIAAALISCGTEARFEVPKESVPVVRDSSTGICYQTGSLWVVTCSLMGTQYPPIGATDVALCFPTVESGACNGATQILPTFKTCGYDDDRGTHFCVDRCPEPHEEFGPPGHPDVDICPIQAQ
jgi:hypothetical protein